jgi:hypothetical protein
MGIRFFGEANNIIGETYKVEIHDTTFSSTPIEVKLGGGIFTQEFDGYDKLFFTPLQPSRCVVPIVVRPTDTAFETFVDSLPLATENRYFIVIRKQTNLYFVGNLLVDQVQYDDNGTYIIELTATDGLKRLEKYYFDEIFNFGAGAEYSEDLNILQKALSYIQFEQFFGNSDVYIESAINWYEVDSDKSIGTLLSTRTQLELFYEDVENLVPKKCSEVIEIILKKYGAFISFVNGRWVINQYSNHAADQAPSFQYSKLQTLLGVDLIGSDISIGGDNQPRATLINTFLPALNRVEVKSSGKSEFAFTRGYSSGLVSTFNPPARTVTNLADESLIFTFELVVDCGVVVRRGFDQVQLKFNINEGTYYLKWDFATSTAIWTTTNTDRYYYNMGYGYEGQLLKLTGQFQTPPVPTASTGTSLNVSVTGEVFDIFTGSRGTIQFGAGSLKVSQAMFGSGLSLGTELDQTYVAQLTTNLEYSEVISEDVMIYESTNNVEFVKEQPQIDNGTAWVNSKEWSTNVLATSGVQLGELLSKEAIYHQRYPNKMIQGGFRFDSFYPYDTLVWRSKRWVFIKGTYSAKMCEWTGDWVEYRRLTTATTFAVKAPIRDRLKRFGDIAQDGLRKDGGNDGTFMNVYFELEQLKFALSGLLLEHKFDTSTTMADPGVGDFRYNAASHASTTAMAISKETSNGIEINGLLSGLLTGDILYIHQKDDSAKWARFSVNGTLTDNTTWWQIPLTYISGSSALPDNNKVCTINISHVG